MYLQCRRGGGTTRRGADARAQSAPPAMSFLKLQPTQLNGRTFSKRVCTLNIKDLWVGSSIES